jgi:hypothetical protein
MYLIEEVCSMIIQSCAVLGVVLFISVPRQMLGSTWVNLRERERVPLPGTTQTPDTPHTQTMSLSIPNAPNAGLFKQGYQK